jgi:hypothetical protein
VNNLRHYLFILLSLLWKGGEDMMSLLWAQQINLGKKSFAQVPAKLREAVRELLIDSGLPELAE